MVLAHTDLPEGFSVPELPRWGFHDRGDMADLPERVRTNGWGLAHGRWTPNHDDVELVAEILAGGRCRRTTSTPTPRSAQRPPTA